MFDRLIEGTLLPLEKRRIRLDACRQYGMKCAKLQDRAAYVAEYRQGSTVVAQRLAYLDDGFSVTIGPMAEVQLFGQHLYNPGGKKLVLAFDEIEAMTISQAQNFKWPVVGVPTPKWADAAVKREYEYVNSFGEIILAFDNSQDSKMAIEKIASMFPPGKVKVMSFRTELNSYTSANEMLLNNCTADQIVNQIWRAAPYRPDGIVTLADLRDRILAHPEPGLMTPYPGINSRLQGLRFSRLFLFTAGSGIGKSTLVHEIAHHNWVQHGIPTGVMALEEKAERTAHRYIGMDLGRPVHLGWTAADEPQILASYERLLERGNLCFYDHWGSSQIDNLLSKMRYMIHGEGCRQLVLDHISIVVSGLDGSVGESERIIIDRLMTGLRTLVNETDVMLLAIVHLKRKEGANGQSFNEGKPVSITDLRGSASLEQLSDAIISLERNQQDEDKKNFALLRVLKDRDIGDTGEAGYVEYVPATGRLLPYEDNPFKTDTPQEDNHGEF